MYDKIAFCHDDGSMMKYHKNLTTRGYRALILRYIVLRPPNLGLILNEKPIVSQSECSDLLQMSVSYSIFLKLKLWQSPPKLKSNHLGRWRMTIEMKFFSFGICVQLYFVRLSALIQTDCFWIIEPG